MHLTPWQDSELRSPRYRCGIYAAIAAEPGAEFEPAFGAGCSSPLFNTDRDAILVELRTRR